MVSFSGLYDIYIDSVTEVCFTCSHLPTAMYREGGVCQIGHYFHFLTLYLLINACFVSPGADFNLMYTTYPVIKHKHHFRAQMYSLNVKNVSWLELFLGRQFIFR